jgi:N6-L-threonylcarbamoyladenine synthase
MKVLGIETSCDETAAAVVENGIILSNVVATQIPFHAKWQGVVPEVASRMHTEWITAVVSEALEKAGLKPQDAGGVAVTGRPGLLGSLLVGLHFAKAFAWARDIPFIAVDHLLAHLYASQLRYAGEEHFEKPEYPFLGLLVSGGHSVICKVEAFDEVTVLGTTIDDAVGEAFDKVAKFYGFGYPGGRAIDELAKTGDAGAFAFPLPNLYKTGRDGRRHDYDVSYSGLKTAVVNQLDKFRVKQNTNNADLAASFQKTAVDILLRSLFKAAENTGLDAIVAGGGVAANSYLRERAAEWQSEKAGRRIFFPPLELCGDNGAMAAGIGERYLLRGDRSGMRESASARVKAFRKRYP